MNGRKVVNRLGRAYRLDEIKKREPVSANSRFFCSRRSFRVYCLMAAARRCR
jgi:hypothetical protein